MGGGVAITCDGNSLTAGLRSSNPAVNSYPAVLATLAPIVGTGTTVTNLGISGQTGQDMTNSRGDVSGAWVSGKKNVLICYEFTNSVYSGRTPTQAVDDLLAYVAAVKATNKWIVAVATCPPAYAVLQGDALNQANSDKFNALLDAANAQLAARWRGVADYFIDMRANGSQMNITPYTPAAFAASGMFVQENGLWLHCSDAGYAAMAQAFASAIARMPGR
ncbi:MAG: SGNH/GDSL hydrolase family protein [Burkholderiaceae bacterium]|nr:SGNH/GDSL hydrolase family protein [Burkholderiaceae bacterium]